MNRPSLFVLRKHWKQKQISTYSFIYLFIVRHLRSTTMQTNESKLRRSNGRKCIANIRINDLAKGEISLDSNVSIVVLRCIQFIWTWNCVICTQICKHEHVVCVCVPMSLRAIDSFPHISHTLSSHNHDINKCVHFDVVVVVAFVCTHRFHLLQICWGGIVCLN